jgi:hypothetical protein
VVNTIIWQYTFIGVEVNGAANYLSGVHAWGSGCGQFDYLTGIKVNSYQTRIIGSYLDFNYLDLMSPQSTSVDSTFFLGTHTRIFGQGAKSGGSVPVAGLFMEHNLGDSVPVIASCGRQQFFALLRDGWRARVHLPRQKSTRFISFGC